MRKTKKPLITISSIGDDISIDIERANFDELTKDMQPPDTPFIIPLIAMMEVVTESLIEDYSEEFSNNGSSAWNKNIELLIGAKNLITTRTGNDLVAIFVDEEGNISLRISDNIGQVMSGVDTTKDVPGRYHYAIEAMVSAIAIMAAEAISCGGDEQEVLVHLINSFTESLNTYIPNLRVELSTQQPVNEEHINSPSKSNNGHLPS